MRDIVERLLQFEGSDALGDGDFSVCIEAAAEITRLQAELAEARDKALDEAAEACDSHRYGDSFLDSCHLRKEHRQDIAQAIRALKSPKPSIL